MERKLFVFSCIAFLILIDVSVQARNLEDKIVFVSERRGIPEVFLVEGLDGRPFQLTRNLFASSPSISPDGTEVVFVSDPPAHAANILKLNIAKRRIEQLTHNAKQDIRYKSLDWSPDGRKILFITVTDTPEDSRTDLCVMDIKRRHIRHILQPDLPTKIFHPSWDPDSNHILYHQDTRDSSGIFIIDDNGNNVINILQEDRFKSALFLPAWSPKRDQIGYIDLVATKHSPLHPLQIYMMDLTKASVTALTSGGDEEKIPLAWHPDGQKILFVTLSLIGQETLWTDIFVMDNNGENIINLTQTPEIEMYASWSPDGGQIVFDREVGENDSAIFIMEADGQNPQQLTFEPGLNFAPSWSPDGNKIAFLSDRNGAHRIYTMDTNGQNVQQVTHHGREFDGPPAWSPDGRWLAFVSGDDEGWGLYITDPQGHNENLIVRSNPIPLSMLAWNRPAWSPDSQHLIYVVEEQNSEGLMKIRIDGNMPTRLKTDELVNWSNPVWSPGGNNLLFSAREAREPTALGDLRISLMNLDTSQKHVFVLPEAFQKNWAFNRLVWGPDGSQLILSVGESVGEKDHQHSLYLIDIPNETITLWMEDAYEADWVRPGFVYAVEAIGKRITTWGELKKPEVP